MSPFANSEEVYIVSGVRTAIGSFGGSLSSKSAVELGSTVIKAALEQANIPYQHVDEVIMGCVLISGQGQNPARLATLQAGLPYTICAHTVNMVCGSGMQGIFEGIKSIKSKDANIVVAGGMENMSQAPYILPDARTGFRLGHKEVIDTVIKDGLWCGIEDIHMGITAENIAQQWEITREEQDEFSYLSQTKALKAQELQKFSDEIIPIEISTRKSSVVFQEDEYVRKGTTIEALSKLKSVFIKDGTVTAGNASGINDGAAAVVLASKEAVESYGLSTYAKVISYAQAGVDPKIMGIGPVYAIKKLLEQTGYTTSEIDLFEINEAFASQSIAVIRELELDPNKVNVNGGAIALGHPIGASGARILVTLIHEMKKRNVSKSIAALCVGGGMGVAMLVERS